LVHFAKYPIWQRIKIRSEVIQEANMSQIIVVMGVSGSGKTTAGQALAKQLAWHFYEGDAFHQPGSLAKMKMGLHLNDSDRAPWLAKLHSLIQEHLDQARPAVITCSALKRDYREKLKGELEDVIFVYLRGSDILIRERLKNRKGHFFEEGLLRSQFEILEEPGPDEAIIVDINQRPSEIVGRLVRTLSD
jgi:gluconokinase